MANYEYVGTLKNGRHYIVELGKEFVAGELVPLTSTDVVAFGDKFSNIRLAEVPTLSAAEKEAAEKEAAEAAEKEAAEKEAGKGKK